MKNLKFAVLGCGFWADYQIAAWKELEGIELMALYNRTGSKAKKMAEKYQVPSHYDNAERLLDQEDLDFVDIITDVGTHAYFTSQAAQRGLAVICQKPMAPGLESAEKMLQSCKSHDVPLFIHENFRWQAPLRKLKSLLMDGVIGDPFKARVSFCSAFPVYDNQPFLSQLEEFILTDIGSHILDVTRFLFGEAESVYAHIQRINPAIKGEDVANVVIRMKNGMHCYTEMSYASIREKEVFPQTLVFVEGSRGSISLEAGFQIKIHTKKHNILFQEKPIEYPWADPLYSVVHSSIVDCNRNILRALQGSAPAETTGNDNLETVKLVWASYESARKNKVIRMDEFAMAPLNQTD